MSVNLASMAATVGLWAGSSSQHCCIRSTSLESTASTLDPGGTRGRNGGVSPLRTLPTTSVPHRLSLPHHPLSHCSSVQAVIQSVRYCQKRLGSIYCIWK